MKKHLLSLLLFSFMVISFVVPAYAHDGTYQYRWATTESTCTGFDCSKYDVTNPSGWPFDDGHFNAAFYGNEYSSSQWVLKHFHLYYAKGQSGDKFRQDNLILYNAANGNTWSSNAHSGHNHGLYHTEETTVDFYATKNKSRVIFEITNWFYLNGSLKETFYGRKWRDGATDGLSF